MKCDGCDADVLPRKATADHPYKYALSGVPNVYLVGITVLAAQVVVERRPAIPHVPELHRLMTEVFVSKPGPLTGAELRFLRKNAGSPRLSSPRCSA